MPSEVIIDGVLYVPASTALEVTTASLRHALFALCWNSEFTQEEFDEHSGYVRVDVRYDRHASRHPSIDELVLDVAVRINNAAKGLNAETV